MSFFEVKALPVTRKIRTPPIIDYVVLTVQRMGDKDNLFWRIAFTFPIELQAKVRFIKKHGQVAIGLGSGSDYGTMRVTDAAHLPMSATATLFKRGGGTRPVEPVSFVLDMLDGVPVPAKTVRIKCPYTAEENFLTVKLPAFLTYTVPDELARSPMTRVAPPTELVERAPPSPFATPDSLDAHPLLPKRSPGRPPRAQSTGYEIGAPPVAAGRPSAPIPDDLVRR